MPVFPGVGQRIRERLVALGYTKPDGSLRVQDFALEHVFPGAFVYDWLSDRRTPLKDLARLAEALETSPAWLCFGDGGEVVTPRAAPQKKRPTGSARRGAQALPVGRPRERRRLGLRIDPYRIRGGVGVGALCKVPAATRRLPRAA